MAQSNRAAVEANNIPPDERLDLTIPRNGSLSFDVAVTDVDDNGVETPTNLTGATILAACKTSYEAKSTCLTATVSNRDDVNGAFRLTYDASAAQLGIDVIDFVHDLLIGPSGGGEPVRYWSGLMTLSKGVGRIG